MIRLQNGSLLSYQSCSPLAPYFCAKCRTPLQLHSFKSGTIDDKQTWTAGQVVIKSLLFLYFTRKVTKIMIHFVVLFSRQGKVRLQKWYEAKADTGGNKLL